MSSLNKWCGIGHLGADPEIRYMPSGESVANVSIATTERWKDKGGQKQESTEWIQLAFFGKLAEIAEDYLQKGSLIYVEGPLKTRKWEDKNGVVRYSTSVTVREMKMLGGRGDRDDRDDRDRNNRGRNSESRGRRDTREGDDYRNARDGEERETPKQQGRTRGFVDDLADDIPF